METRSILLAVGLLVTIWGISLHVYARHHYRTPQSPGLWPQVRPSRWRERREWFSSEDGYRLSRRGALMISAGGFIALIGSFL